MAFLAVFLSPALLEFAVPFDVSVAVHYGRALGFIAAALLLPLLLGMAVRGTVGGAVGKLSKICTLASAAAFVAIVLLIMSERKEAISAVGKKAELSMLLFVVLSMIAGWIMGGPARETRHVLATVTGMRNVALSLLIAMKTFPDPAVQTPLVAFSALMVTPNTIYAVIWVLRTKRAARAGSKPGPVKRDQG
jgi:BASS family bile acid:Na+ symporter